MVAVEFQTIWSWAGLDIDPKKPSFRDAQELIKARQIIKCGKLNEDNEVIRFSALCSKTPDSKDGCYTVNGTVKNSAILECSCDCEIGQEKCQHVLATLIHCYRKSFDLENWATPTGELTTTKKRPLQDKEITVESEKNINKINPFFLPRSKKPKTSKQSNGFKKDANLERAVAAIFENQDSELMNFIRDMKTDKLQECCEKLLKSFEGDYKDICEKTAKSHDFWLQQRQYRITGSMCYIVYTYSSCKRPNWPNKCSTLFTPNDYKNKYMEYGNKTEPEARQAFIKNTNFIVKEVGLVISKSNPWMGYSPDGIIFQNGKPTALLEIKCPYIGKTSNIQATIEAQCTKYLVRVDENIELKKKHSYYGQVQLGMAVLNLNVAYFVVYSARDKKYLSIKVPRDEDFLMEMLPALKESYFNHMLHNICLMKK
ncbi:hypothetical protein TKK_0005142 [Trichogramma kaykai]|uniref:SWIM-type domain-containing protein n=1 Tax=Trichogramma kaykai TaxID=54128 RepID=A0ABD2XJI4_9HYME